MVQANQFQFLRIQASAFFSENGVRPSRILGHIPENWEAIYDADPISLPVPADAPGNIPSIILRNTGDTERVQISRTRVDISLNFAGTPGVDLLGTLEELAGRLAQVLDLDDVSFGRLAAITTRIAQAEHPGIILSRQFCRNEWVHGPLNRPEGFELHAHKAFDLLANVRVNSWMRIKTAKMGAGAELYNGVLVEQDMNTLDEERSTRHFARDELISWYRAASRELDSILELYFPNVDRGNGG